MNRRNLWVTWAVIVGAAFGIAAVTNARGIVYVVIGIIAAAGYSAIHQLTRKPLPAPGPPFPPGPEA